MGDEPRIVHRFPPDDRTRVIGTLAAREREEQTRQLDRVSRNIDGSVLAFFRERAGQTFFAAELQEYVATRHKGAPASADRVMRALKARKELNYDCINRARSLYRVLPVRAL